MGYSVELYFDEASRARLQSLQNACTQFGGLPPRSDDARPHVSLVVAETLDLPAAQVLVRSFASANKPFELSLASVGFFPSTEQVAFLAPKVNTDLLALHAEFFGLFGTVASGIWQHYSPAQWVPHCTLATRYPGNRVQGLLELCGSLGLPLCCKVVEMGIVHFPPARQLSLVRLG